MDTSMHDIQVSSNGNTVWVTGFDGTCIGRFSKRFGLDVHTTMTDQINGKKECLYCTHQTANEDDWKMFVHQIKINYDIEVPGNLVTWS